MKEHLQRGSRVCFLCGRWENPYNPMEIHHIFRGPNRKKSTKYGLVVPLCHSCHNEPPDGVHYNKDVMQRLHEYGQRKAMEENGWTVKDFIREFGRNYLEDV